jgi:signal transduction histidine kinase
VNHEAIVVIDLVVLGVVLLAAVPVAIGLGRATGAARQRLELVTAGALVSLSIAGVAGWLGLLGAFDRSPQIVLAGWLLIPISLLLGLSPSARRRAEWCLRGGLSVLAYALVVVAAEAVGILVAGELPAQSNRWVLAAGIVATGIAAAAIVPSRRRFVDATMRLVRGERQGPEDVVANFGMRAASGVAHADLLLQLAESLRRTMVLQRAEVWTGTAGLLERTVSVPDRPSTTIELTAAEEAAFAGAGVVGEAWLAMWQPQLVADRPADAQVRVVPAAQGGNVLGLVVAERAADHDQFTPDDDRALAELGRRLGVVLRNRQLDATLRATLDDLRLSNEELRASRARLMTAADHERNRIERNLHDGAQQHLVALALNVRLIRDVLAEDPEGAGEMLDELAVDVRAAVEELRTLAHGIYPPLLREAGLGEALRAAAKRASQPVRVTVGDGEQDLPRPGPDAEAAIYFCCMEALANSSKHSPEANIDLRVWHDGDVVRFEVRDDGPGFDPETVSMGHGLQHMSDRLGAVGGEVAWDAAPGAGVTVRGWVPVATDEAA